MNTLFPLDDIFPAGFSYQENFITRKEEIFLMDAVKKIELHPMLFQGFEAKRKVASYGYDYHFENRTLTKGKEIPLVFEPLIQKFADQLHVAAENIAELLVTEYPPGALINWHRDAPPFDIIAGLSLGADCIFKLRPYEKSLQTRKAVISIPVNRRSVYVMKDAARSEWQHSTAAVSQTRYSITIRTLRQDVKK